MLRRSLAFMFFIILSSSLALGMGRTEIADTVLYNGLIYTVDSNRSFAESIAIKDQKIIYLGPVDGLQSYLGQETRQIDLKGKMVLPGFIDSHMHPFSVAWYRYNLNIFNPYSVAETLREIREYVAANPDKNVIEGVGYLRSIFVAETGEPPTKAILDAIDNTRPILILDKNGHSGWANSRALELAGFDENTPDPKNGTIERLPNTPGYGEPSGQLLEEALILTLDAFPVPTEQEVIDSLKLIQPTLAAYGVTTVHEMAPDFTERRQIAMFNGANRMAMNGEMTFRMRGSWLINPTKGDPERQINDYAALSKNYTHNHFQANGMKFLVDGIIEELTGLLLEPYCDRIVNQHKDCTGTNFGFDIWAEANQDLAKAFAQVHQLGFQINAHTIGDGAVRKTLEALEQAKIPPEARPTLEHIQMSQPADIPRMAKLGISANVTPIWMELDDYFTQIYYPHLGFERATTLMYPYQSLMDAGVNVTTGSDWYVSEPDIPQHIFTAMTRLFPQRIYDKNYAGSPQYPYYRDLNKVFTPEDFDPHGQSQYPIGSLPPAKERARSLEQVIETFTINVAKANFLEHQIGSLEVGKTADLVVMNTNFFDVAKLFYQTGRADDLEPIANSKVMMTMFEGKIIYQADE